MNDPTDRPRSKFASTRGERLYLTLPPDAVVGIDALIRKNGATMLMGSLTAFYVLMRQWSGCNDMVVGTPFADRWLDGTKALLGVFINNSVLRTDVPENADFSQLSKGVRKVCFGAYRHNSVPFQELVEHLRPVRQ